MKNNKLKYQIGSLLVFPLEEINKYKNNQNIISIYDCFSYYQKIETLSGDNAIPCCYCKSINISNYMSSIYLSPEIFILIINKPKFSPIKFEFYEIINLSKFIVNNIGCFYTLIGVVSELNGDYIAYCKNSADNKLYKYDNDYVYPANDFKGEIIDSANPHILFYQKAK